MYKNIFENRRSNGISNLYGDCIFDCGASSGYGSPGVAGTPLTSPAPNSAHYIAHQLQTIIDQEFNETMINSNQVINLFLLVKF